MTIRISVSTEYVGPVVRLQGWLDAELVEVATEGLLALEESGGAVVVDLRDAVVASPDALAQFIDRLSHQTKAGRISVVCDRLSGRRLVRMRCRTSPVVVFTDLRQALRS